MLLDATQGEEKLSHTESNREHVWRLLQGGELIAPVPPLPPRSTPADPAPSPMEDAMSRTNSSAAAQQPAQTGDASSAPSATEATAPKPTEAQPHGQKSDSVVQEEPGAAPASDPPKRRRKKTAETVLDSTEAESKAAVSTGLAGGAEPIAAGTATSPTKPRRPRRVGEPKPRRYPVGEQETRNGT